MWRHAHQVLNLPRQSVPSDSATHLAIASGSGLWQLKKMRCFRRSQESKYRYSHQQRTGCSLEHFLLSWNVRSVFFSLSPTSPSRTHSATLKQSHRWILGMTLSIRPGCRFHQVLMQNQCGDVTMRVLEYESQRAQAGQGCGESTS